MQSGTLSTCLLPPDDAVCQFFLAAVSLPSSSLVLRSMLPSGNMILW